MPQTTVKKGENTMSEEKNQREPLLPSDYYDLKELAETLQLNINTLYREIERGKLTAYKFGKEYKVTKEDAREYVESKRVAPRQQSNSSDDEE
jgi:excisionase family DNA binding protein